MCVPFSILYDVLTAFQPTSRRLGEAAASTAVYAGYKRSFSHCLFRGVSAAVAPNRQVIGWHFLFIL